jgi:hypothetical protein
VADGKRIVPTGDADAIAESLDALSRSTSDRSAVRA